MWKRGIFMIGIGIDTGGTYTDAVVYNLETNQILASAKSLTTKEDLKTGIHNVLEKLPGDMLSSCGALSLSTTLATNAWRGKQGRKRKAYLDRAGPPRRWNLLIRITGSNSLEHVYLLECELTPKPSKSRFSPTGLSLPKTCKTLPGTVTVSVLYSSSQKSITVVMKKERRK